MAEEAEAMCVKWILGGNPLEMMPEVGDINANEANCWCVVASVTWE